MPRKPTEDDLEPEWALILPDLSSEDVGSEVLFATDEWFAPAKMLLQNQDPVWKEGEFTAYGKWMDGWESRRRRTEGHDWCIVQLGLIAHIRGVLMDTAFFTGNQVPHFNILGTYVDASASPSLLKNLRTKGEMGTCATAEQIKQAEAELEKLEWTELVPVHPLLPGYPETRKHYFESNHVETPITHLRLNYFPDGGVARLRVYGQVEAPRILSSASPPTDVDLLAVANGGVALAWSNEHYGLPRNLLLPHKAPNMGNGWETARNPHRPRILKRGRDGQILFVGRDWVVFKLAVRAKLKRVMVDTNHFKGNFPESAVIEGLDAPAVAAMDVIDQRQLFQEPKGAPAPLVDDGSSSLDNWVTLLPRTKMEPHCERVFDLKEEKAVTHVRLTVLPDGGVSRLRIYGTPELKA